MWLTHSQLNDYFKAWKCTSNLDSLLDFVSSPKLTWVRTMFSLSALAWCSTLIFSSSCLTASSMASMWRCTLSTSSPCSLLSCSSMQTSSSCRIWWRAANSPLTRACRSAPTLYNRDKWAMLQMENIMSHLSIVVLPQLCRLVQLKLLIASPKVHISRERLMKQHFASKIYVSNKWRLGWRISCSSSQHSMPSKCKLLSSICLTRIRCV